MTRKTIFAPVVILMLCGTARAQKAWTLHDCMEYAVEHAPEYKIQELSNANLRKDLRDAKLGFLPNISAGISGSTNFGRNIDPETNTYTSVNTFSNNYSVSGSLTLFDGFSVVNKYRIARIASLQGVEQSRLVADQITLETMQAYFNVMYYRGLVELAEEQLAQSRKNLHFTKVQEELGLKGNADVLQIEAQVASDDHNLVNQRNLHDDALLTLKQVMFYPIEEELPLDSADRWAVEPLAAKEVPDSIYQSALATLPELQVSRMDIGTAKLSYKTSIWQLLPSISASGGYSTAYSKVLNGDQGVTPTFREQMRDRAGQYVTVNLNIPIFSGLVRQSNIVRNRNRLKEAEYRNSQKEHEVESEIKRAVQDMEGAAKAYVSSMKQVLAQESAHKANVRKFEEGLLSVLDLQISANELLKAKAERLNNKLQYQLKRRVVNYYKGIPYIDQEY